MKLTFTGGHDSVPTTTMRTDSGARQKIEGIPLDAFFYAPSTLTRADFARFFPGDQENLPHRKYVAAAAAMKEASDE